MSRHEPETPEQPVSPRSPWHPVNVAHLVMGVAFLGLTLVWLLVETDVVEPIDTRWLLPAPWLVAGAIGLLAVALRGRRGHRPRTTPPPDGEHRPG